MKDFRPSHELLTLTAQLTDGGLSDTELERLRQIVADDRKSALWFVEWMELSAMLHLDFGRDTLGALTSRPLCPPCSASDPILEPEADDAAETSCTATRCAARKQSVNTQEPSPPRRRSYWFTLATCLLIGLSYVLGIATAGIDVASFSGTTMVSPPLIDGHPPLPQIPVATISAGVDAVFDGDHTLGSRLTPGVVHLKRGIAQIAFDSGAILVLEGPAEFEVIDNSTCRLLSGSVSADVFPDATGFSIAAGRITVAEQNAQFGLRTGPERETEVHAFGGELELVDFRQAEGQVQTIAAGNGVRWQSGHLAQIESDPASFITRQELARRQRESEQKSYARWVNYSQRWLGDPSVIVRYEFGPTEEMAISNTVGDQAHRAVASHAPRWIGGRWSDKPAMLFDGRTDVLKVADHTDLRQSGDMSMAIWLRARSYPRSAWARVVGKGFGPDRNYGLWVNSRGRFLWQVIPDLDPANQSVWDRHSLHTGYCPSGEWLLIVGVVDGKESRVYVNGTLHNSGPVPEKIANSDAPLTIGFYDEVPGHDEYFCGELDELILLDRALTPSEIREMFEAGHPKSEPKLKGEPQFPSPQETI